MESPREAAETYRVIVTRRDASEIFLLPNGSEWALPRVEIQPHQRLAEQLTAAVAKAWGIEAYCLFLPKARTSESNREARSAVMETVRHNDKSPAGTYWMPSSAGTRSSNSAEASAIRESLTELDSYVKSEKAGPFAKPAWLRELFLWSQEQIGPLDLRLTGGFKQLNASPTFSLIRLETGQNAVWFKATGEPNRHEFPVTVFLTRHVPAFVPPLVAVHTDWNGWLAWEAPGQSLDECFDVASWEKAAEAFAKLQIQSLGHGSELIDAGCKDLRLCRVAEQIEPFLDRMSEFMAAQQKTEPAALQDAELAFLGAQLKEACALLESLTFPDALGHIDLNPGNILISPEKCTFLDWAEGCVTQPFLTFEYLREHARRCLAEPSTPEKITYAYARPWSRIFSPDSLTKAMTVSPLLAVLAYALAGEKWRSPDTPHDSTLAGYFRSLTRRMHREAKRFAERSEPCPA